MAELEAVRGDDPAHLYLSLKCIDIYIYTHTSVCLLIYLHIYIIHIMLIYKYIYIYIYTYIYVDVYTKQEFQTMVQVRLCIDTAHPYLDPKPVGLFVVIQEGLFFGCPCNKSPTNLRIYIGTPDVWKLPYTTVAQYLKTPKGNCFT